MGEAKTAPKRKRRRIVRPMLKWSGLVMSVVIVGAFVVSRWYVASLWVTHKHGVSTIWGCLELERLDELIHEHDTGLEKCVELCQEAKRAVDVFPALFKGRISEGNLIMATGEALAHLNYLVARGALTVESDGDGVDWYRQA